MAVRGLEACAEAECKVRAAEDVEVEEAHDRCRIQEPFRIRFYFRNRLFVRNRFFVRIQILDGRPLL